MSDRLARLFATLALRTRANAAVLDRLQEWVRDGSIRDHDVEPSIAIGARARRIGVNTSSKIDEIDLRASLTSELLGLVGVRSEAVHARAKEWVRDRRHEAFIAIDERDGSLRSKLYFRAHRSARSELSEIARALAPEFDPIAEDTHTVCIDFEDGEAVSGKRYRWLAPDESRARFGEGRVMGLLIERGIDPEIVAMHASEPLHGSMPPVLHAQVLGHDDVDLGCLLARRLGEVELETWCASVPLETRVLGERLDPPAYTVYLGMPHAV